MITKDGEKFDFTKDPSYKEFTEAFSHPLKSKTLIFKCNPVYFKDVEHESDKGIKTKRKLFPTFMWEAQHKFVNEDGLPTEYKYYSNTPKYDKITRTFEGKASTVEMMDSGGGVVFSMPRELEKAWFVWRFCSRIKGGMSENTTRKRGYSFLYVENKQAEASLLRKNSKTTLEAELKIWDMREDAARALYEKVFLSPSDPNATHEEVQSAIVDMLKHATTNESVMKHVGINSSVDIKSLVQEAIALELLSGDETGTKVVSGGPNPAKLAPIGFMTDNFGPRLTEYLTVNPDALKKLENAINKVKAVA
jgi:hypothetical protein